MREVALAAGVSKNAVSLAMRGDPSIPPATRERILSAAAGIGYAKNATVSHLMAALRAGRHRSFQATLALLNANESRTAFETHPTIPAYVEGIRRAARREGYALDTFWLHDPELDSTRLTRILRTRGIRGGLVVGLMDGALLPKQYHALWSQFPFVVTGVRTRNPALPCVCSDLHDLLRQAVQKVVSMGYRRPGLVLDDVIDALVDGRFTAGFHAAQQMLTAGNCIPPFFKVRTARTNPALFPAWQKRHAPDVIFTLYGETRRWLESAGLRVPQDIGLVQLEWRAKEKGWAGMNQHNDLTGETAVENLIGLIHRSDLQLPPPPRTTMIPASWVDGDSARHVHASAM